VPAPTIKHYMREGLLPGPEKRTSRNMAYYDPRLAARVKVIKQLQSTRFLPLKIIGDVLEPAPSSAIRADLDDQQREQLGALAPAIVAGTADARRDRSAAHPDRSISREQVLATLQVTGEELDDLAKNGLSEPTEDGFYSGADLELLEVISETRDIGMGDLFPMPILAPYAEAIRGLVRMEIDLFRHRVLDGAQLPQLPLDQVARNATKLAERMIVAMRAKLVNTELLAVAGGNGADDS
jgi:DNA-binding transcriptional MerR regulator